MTFYQIIYNWFLDLLDGSGLDSFVTSVGTNSTNFEIWLAHTGTIIVLISICVLFYVICRYLFKAAAGLFKW